MLMTFLNRVTNSDEKMELKAIFCSVGHFPHRQVARVGDQC
jgi:hypothetical protein